MKILMIAVNYQKIKRIQVSINIIFINNMEYIIGVGIFVAVIAFVTYKKVKSVRKNDSCCK